MATLLEKIKAKIQETEARFYRRRLASLSEDDPTLSVSDGDADERRQVTTMFCDLVHSTRTSNVLNDDEVWRNLLMRYYRRCREVIDATYGGSVTYEGDGVLAFFGFPTAHEDDAWRAVRAGIEIRNSFANESWAEKELLEAAGLDPLRVRVGIHTGSVVVGKMGPGETQARQPTGWTIAHTRGLQGLASPNEVVVSHDTYNLVEAYFEFKPLGRNSLKESDPTECFVALSEKEPLARFGTPLCGRMEEMRQLESIWQSIKSPAAEFALIRGEAGIGKSRLTHEFRTEIEKTEGKLYQWDCSPYFQNSALYPVIQGLRNLVTDRLGELTDELEVIEDLLPEPLDKDEIVPAIASLLSIPCEPRYRELSGTAEQKKNIVREALVAWFSSEVSHDDASATRPRLLIVIEDVNWADPSTLELLQRLSESLKRGSIMLLLTCRTPSIGDGQMWECPFPHKLINLERLSSESSRELAVLSAGGDKLREDVIRLLVSRTDGVPLFIEESARMLVESMASAESDSNGRKFDESIEHGVPPTIQDLLTARLDRLGPAKRIAQLSSVIGREFSREVLEAVADLDRPTLSMQISSLLASGQIRARSTDARNEFEFKHALVRDVAYQSLLSDVRRDYHGRIALALAPVGADPGEADEPELIAHHFTVGESLSRAARYWVEAGRRAKTRSALTEAINHFNQALDLHRSIPSDPESDANELEAQLSVASCYAGVRGYSSKEAEDAFDRSEYLAEKLGNEDSLLRSRFGVEAYLMMQGKFAAAIEMANICREMAEAAHPGLEERPLNDAARADLMARAQSYWVIGNIQFHQGEFETAMTHMDACLSWCEKIEPELRRFHQDPGVMCHVYRAWYKWEAGFITDALSEVRKGVEIARKCGHPFGIGVALAFEACIYFFQRDYEKAEKSASESIKVCEEPDFRTWLAWAKVLRGRAVSEFGKGEIQAGITEIEEGLRLWHDSGAVVTRPFALALLAEAYQLQGQTEKSLELIGEAQATIDKYGERYYEPEVKRLFGVLSLESGAGSDVSREKEAERSFQEAISVANARGMKSSALRATVDLSQLLILQGSFSAALDALRTAYSNIPEEERAMALSTYEKMGNARSASQSHGPVSDLVRARVLLDRLEHSDGGTDGA